jgi:hypothetical protein
MNRSVITEDQITELMQAIPKADEVEALRKEIEDLKDDLSWLSSICDGQRQALSEIADEKSAVARRPIQLRDIAYRALRGEF